MLELDEGQLSRPVLRGRGGSNTSLLPGRSVDGSSQWGGSAQDLTPLVWREAWGVGRENSGQVDMGGQPGFPGARDRVALPLSALICGPDGAKTPRKGVQKAVFSKSTTWIIST
jgi:hypothetical protein